MGYYTNFSLSIHEGSVDLEAVHIALDLIMDCIPSESMFYNDGLAIFTQDDTKWYDHDEDCAKLSLSFPDVVFVLHGEGEETGDLWNSYYKNGQCQICRVQLSYPPFDVTKLKSVEQAQFEDVGRQ